MDKRMNVKKIITEWVPMIHAVISIVYEWVTELSVENHSYEMMKVVPGNHISFESEQIMFFVLSKLCGICLIYVLWNLIFYICVKKKIHIVLLLLVGTILILILYPNNYVLEVDNLMLFMNSISYYPDYWQSIYIGVWYNACLMVCRDSLILPLVQTWLFIGAVCYLAEKSKERWGKVAGLVPYVLLILPEVVIICANPYRNAVYVVLGIWYYTMLFFSIANKEKQTWKKLILWSLFSAFMGLMRSEGILILGVFCVACIWLWQCTKKQKIGALISLCIFILVLGIPQKLGEKKYYGKDYQIVNYMDALRNILITQGADFGYDDAEKDLNVINEFVPIEILRNSGLTGFRIYNYETQGTVNQTLKSKAEQVGFLDATSNIIKNNLDIYLNYRLGNFISANGGYDEKNYQISVDRQGYNEVQGMLQQEYAKGVTVILENIWAQEWLSNEWHTEIYAKVYEIQDAYYELLWHFRITWMLRLVSMIMLPVLSISLVYKTRNRESLLCIVVSLTLLTQWVGIALFSPEARPVYYYPIFYFSLAWSWLMIQMLCAKEMEEKKAS